MHLHQLRNATMVLDIGEHRLLIDPMLAEAGEMPGFKIFGGGRRPNPLVGLPEGATELLDDVTAVVLTHEHPDHFDRAARSWVGQRALPLWSNRVDTPHLRASGLQAQVLEDGALGMRVEVVPSRHGRGILGWLMGPVAGYYLAHPGEPSIYLTGDSILTRTVLDAIDRRKPDIVVAPAGAANVGIGGDILFSVDELMTLAHRAPGRVVLNHLEALDHCPTSRDELRARVRAEGLADRVYIPDDGETLSFARSGSRIEVAPRADVREPGFQKWLTAKFAGA